jgi:uncharacterized membrane protein
MDRYILNPFSLLLLFLFFILQIFIVPLLILGIIGGALTNLGFTWTQALLILLLTIIGSFINIPVKKIEGHPVRLQPEYSMVGRLYRIPEVSPTTILAINVGGAVIPVLISLYLLGRALSMAEGGTVLLMALIGIGIVTFITNRVARPVRGLGISTPIFVPPLCALVCGFVLAAFIPFSDPAMASIARPVIAYVSGTIGTLVGADLLNIDKIGELGAPVASIGGAGTFDGIFLTGIIAAFLA